MKKKVSDLHQETYKHVLAMFSEMSAEEIHEIERRQKICEAQKKGLAAVKKFEKAKEKLDEANVELDALLAENPDIAELLNRIRCLCKNQLENTAMQSEKAALQSYTIAVKDDIIDALQNENAELRRRLGIN